ncbi:MAG: hypothetical protein NZ821_08290, partial [Gloeomargarita sp. SKYB31]|nr:hypothetical protein [Gloeomargarita sp. SKYB31]
QVTITAGTITLANIPAGSATDQVLLRDAANQVRHISAASLVSSNAWALGGNAITGTEFLGTTNNQPLRLYTNNAEQLRITPTGDVGIGTTTPSARLHVAGSSRVDGTLTAAADLSVEGNTTLGNAATDQVTITAGTITVANIPAGSATDQVLLRDAANQVRHISAASLVSSNAWSLTGNSGTNPAVNFVGTTDNQPLIIRTNNQQVMRVGTDGTLALNTNTPAATLTIRGAGGTRGTLNVGTDGITPPSGTHYAILGNTTTESSQNVFNVFSDLEVTAASNSSVNYTAGYYNLNLLGSANYTGTLLYAFGGQLDHYGSGTVTNAFGVMGTVVVRQNGTISNGTAVRAHVANVGSGTITTGRGLFVPQPAGSGAITTMVGAHIVHLTRGSNNTLLLLGNTPPTGNYSIYSSSSYPSYIEGSVGIGTTSPSTKLHVTAASDPLRLEGLQTDNTLDNVLVANSSGVVRLRSASSLVGSNAWSLTGNSGTNPAAHFLGTTDNQPLVIRTNNQERIRIAPNGDVGIGTNNPTQRLHVQNGSIHVQHDENSSWSGALHFRKARGSQSSPAPVQSGDETGYIYFRGHDGGTYQPTALIISHVDGNPGVNDMPGRLSFLTTPAGSATPVERVRITNAGNVGIGTITPTTRLHVSAPADPLRLEGVQNASGGVDVLTVTTDGTVKKSSPAAIVSGGIIKGAYTPSSTGSNFTISPGQDIQSGAIVVVTVHGPAGGGVVGAMVTAVNAGTDTFTVATSMSIDNTYAIHYMIINP